VNRDDVRVRARTGYATPAPEAPPAPKDSVEDSSPGPPRILAEILAGPVPSGDLPMRVSVAPFAVPGTTKAAVALVAGVPHAAAGDAAQKFELIVRAFSAHGASTGAVRQAGTLAARGTSRDDATLDLLAQIELPPGRHELRLAAKLDPSNLAGSVFADVDVPDFANAPLSISGVLFETDPPGHAGPLSALEKIVPIVPTTRREFSVRETVIAFARVYQGGTAAALAPASVQVTVEDGHDRLVYNNRFALPVPRFDPATRHADVRFDLPLRAMQPGSHLLTFAARLGTHVARRQVRFMFR
jgi:hypothetical protein